MGSKQQYQCEVQVSVEYLEEQSSWQDNRYAFAYHITITNTGNVAAQLISRHWVIRDMGGHEHEVKGLGVVGEQPFLAPGASFQYTSSTLIHHPIGEMGGTYQMMAEDGKMFDVEIATFALVVPRVLH